MAYTISAGDTLSGIAKKNNTTLDALLKANPGIKNPNQIYTGQNLNLPSAPAPVQSNSGAPKPVAQAQPSQPQPSIGGVGVRDSLASGGYNVGYTNGKVTVDGTPIDTTGWQNVGGKLYASPEAIQSALQKAGIGGGVTAKTPTSEVVSKTVFTPPTATPTTKNDAQIVGNNNMFTGQVSPAPGQYTNTPIGDMINKTIFTPPTAISPAAAKTEAPIPPSPAPQVPSQEDVTQKLYELISAQQAEPVSSDAMFEQVMAKMAPYMAKQEPTLTWEDAIARAGETLNPVYDQRMDQVMKNVNAKNLQSGFYGQLPGEALKRETAVQEEQNRIMAQKDLANQLVGQSESNALQKQQMAMNQAGQIGSIIQSAMQNATQQKQSNLSNLASLVNLITSQSQNRFNQGIAEAGVTGKYGGKDTLQGRQVESQLSTDELQRQNLALDNQGKSYTIAALPKQLENSLKLDDLKIIGAEISNQIAGIDLAAYPEKIRLQVETLKEQLKNGQLNNAAQAIQNSNLDAKLKAELQDIAAGTQVKYAQIKNINADTARTVEATNQARSSGASAKSGELSFKEYSDAIESLYGTDNFAVSTDKDGKVSYQKTGSKAIDTTKAAAYIKNLRENGVNETTVQNLMNKFKVTAKDFPKEIQPSGPIKSTPIEAKSISDMYKWESLFK
ncbi:MAG: LysM domain-containing protein [Candidatus Magnetobacterium sp. LHC-1]